ncbi:S8 family serine peptidase [Streptomyces sp. PT12]|uniref:S8 family serine peptidase n=1 Tax=Streptomyces sp. PT12 TaxID=1510197 RepID=UPI000DE2C2B8|nr:S8 family serine peptidase [Streptomyces sp. PT12]RBM04863.1 peptidase S8 [Streptomyces sp. PT12]
MRWSRRRPTTLITAALLIAAGMTAPAAANGPDGPDAPAGSAGTAGAAGAGGPSATVRLVTGDTVLVSPTGDGRQVAQARPGPGRDDIAFQVREVDGALTVMPSDAWPLVATGALDPRLFDVSGLIAQGYDAARSDALPLILTRPSGVSARAVDSLAELHDEGAPRRDLASIDATSVRIAADELDDFWAELVPEGERVGVAEAAATPRVWLDGRVSASLDRSTGQINAPAAWSAGLDGSGVTVAVLDTGADAEHPDLAGRISRSANFSSSDGTHDAFGHGTHVAATVAGSGAGSDGARRGVAPEADLIVGKVLGDDGYGSDSSVIAGMEWAVDEGADVVNLSLGDDAGTDGLDPVALALNELTASSGALFVVAAGNNGAAGDGSVGSPGSADAALTVGAVDREDALADFSSRGPRPRDGAVKPDVTAPGVGIVAARASGTSMGAPVDSLYTGADGTSMATPHVAGAAALLAQAHPEWSAERLKDALISTSETIADTRVTEQGGGRIDVGAAVNARVTATGTASLGTFAPDEGAADAEPVTLRWTNGSDEPVTLGLGIALATSGGRELPADAAVLDADTITVAPGASEEVTVRPDPEGVAYGGYYGYVTATGEGGEVVAHTTVSLVVSAPVHRVTPRVIGVDGEPLPWDLPLIWGPEGFATYDTSTSPPTALVPEGVHVFATFAENLDAESLPEYRMAYLPEVNVTEDTEVTLDLSETTPVEVRTPEPAEQRTWLTFGTYREIEGRSWSHSVQYPIGQARLWISPSEQVTRGEFEFTARWQLTAPLVTAEVRGAREVDIDPYYLGQSPLFDAREQLAVVDAGPVDEPRFRGARGKLAVLEGDQGDYAELARAAADAGAAGVVLVAAEGSTAWTTWRPVGERFAVPVLRISADEADALLERAERRSTALVLRTTKESPYLYDLMQVVAGGVPDRVVHTVTDRNTARVRATYHDPGAGSGWGTSHHVAWRPYQRAVLVDPPRQMPLGTTRTEYVSSGDTVWQKFAHDAVPWLTDFPIIDFATREAPRTYRSDDSRSERWFGALTRPSIPRGTATPSVRDGDTVRLAIPGLTDSTAGHWAPGTGSLTLTRDGTEVGAASGGFADLAVPAGPGDFRLDLATERDPAEWGFGTRTRTSWSFRSDTAEEPTPLPLLQVDYAVGADAHNAVREGRRHTIGLTVRHQDGLAAPRGVRVRVEVSYDDGATFAAATRVRATGGNAFDATLERPSRIRDDAYVTLRVTATDAAGNEVEQVVERAYLHRG